MKRRILGILNIKTSESKYVFDLLSLQIFVGVANAYINIIAVTFFLKSLSIYLLPVAYLTIAVLLILLNILYEKLEHKWSPLILLKRIIGFSIPVLVSLWFGLFFGNEHFFIFVLLVCSSLFYMVTGYAYWGLVSQLFNVRESKRVFSIVGAGDIPSKLIGYLSAPLLIPFIGLTNLLWMSIASLVAGLIFFSNAIKKRNWDRLRVEHEHEHDIVEKHEHSNIISFFSQNELIFAISILAILSYNVFNFVDFTFLSQVKLKYENIASLAAFIAIFFAAGRVIALVLKLLFSSRVIERLGIITCLFITPAALFVFSLVFFLLGDNNKYILYIFGAMVLFAEVLRSTMQEPVFFILFQPLKEKLRLKGHLISKGYMLPPSLIIVGLSLLIMHQLQIENTILLTIKILLMNLIAWALVIFYIRKAYVKTLHSSIQRGVFNSDDVYLYDAATIEILLGKVNHGAPAEIVFALKVLGKGNYPEFSALLHQQLNSTQKEVKLYVMDQLKTDPAADTGLLKQLIEKETDPDILQKATSLLCKLDTDYLATISENISSLDYPVRKVVIINLFNQGEFNHLHNAGTALNHLIESADTRERELAVEIIGKLNNIRFTKAIENLVNDNATSVKRNAIIVACKLKVQKILPVIVEMLNSSTDKYLALQGLLKYGDELFVDIKHIPESSIADHQKEFVRLAGKLKGHHSTAFLLKSLNESAVMPGLIVESLWKKEYKPDTTADIQKLQVLLDESFEVSKKKLRYFNSLLQPATHELVKNSIFEEIKENLVTALQICSILYERVQINRLLELIEKNDTGKLFNAMEMMEMVLPKKVSKELNVIFDHVIDPSESEKLGRMADIPGLYDNIVFTFEKEFNTWTKAVCIYNSWKINEYTLINKLRGREKIKQPLIMEETTDYVLNALTRP